MKLTLAVKGGIYIYILALVLIGGKVWAQDPEFSQFYANPIYTNPAFAGGSTVGRGVLAYRSQWPSIPGTFRTFSASYDEHFDAINGGIGFILAADEAGVGTLRTIAFSGVYSYQINLSRYVTMRAGIQAGINQKSIDFSKLQFFDQIVRMQGFVNPTGETPLNTAIFYPNFAAGTVIYSSKFYVGFAAHNLNQPEQGFYKSGNSNIPMRFTGHGGLVIPMRKSRDPKKATNLYPNVLYMQQSASSQINLGMYYNHGSFVFGGYFRQTSNNPDAVIFLLGLRTSKVKIGFSYDATISDISYGAKQSYEVTLGFELRKRVPRTKVRRIICPDF
jgi:type IX secretion system PorP/SprF family membrane protein